MLLEPRDDLPLVQIQMRVGAGAATDTDERAGAAELATRLLREGTRRRSALEIESRLDHLGAIVEEELDHDGIDITAEFLQKDLREGLEIVMEMLLEPAFHPDAVRRQRDLLIEDIRSLRDEPDELADACFQHLLHTPHPYHRSEWGSVESVQRVERDHVLAFHREHVRPDRLWVGVAGAINGLDIEREIDRLIDRSIPTAATPEAEPADGSRVRREPRQRHRMVVIDRPGIDQTHLRIGGPGVTAAHPDLDVIEVANSIVGGGYTSRLMQEIRTRRGLVYDIGSSFDGGLDPGSFLVETSTAHKTAPQTVRVILDLLRRFRDHGPDADEVRRAIRYRLGMFAFETETAEAVLEERMDMAFYGLPDDYLDGYRERIGSLTRQDVVNAARTHFPAEGLLIVAVSDLGENRERLRDLAEEIGADGMEELDPRN